MYDPEIEREMDVLAAQWTPEELAAMGGREAYRTAATERVAARRRATNLNKRKTEHAEASGLMDEPEEDL